MKPVTATEIGVIVGFLLFAFMSFLCVVCCCLRGWVISERNQSNDSSKKCSMQRVNTRSIFKACVRYFLSNFSFFTK